MKTRPTPRRTPLVAVLAIVAAVLMLMATPALATEGSPEDGGGRLTFPETAHDQVGLIILAGVGIFALGALGNAVRQLRGERPQADGKIRWR